MMQSLAGRVVLVTGATSGLGEKLANVFFYRSVFSICLGSVVFKISQDMHPR